MKIKSMVTIAILMSVVAILKMKNTQFAAYAIDGKPHRKFQDFKIMFKKFYVTDYVIPRVYFRILFLLIGT